MQNFNKIGFKKCGLMVLALTFLLAAILTTSFPALSAEADSGYTLPPSTQLTAAAYGHGTYVVAGSYTASVPGPSSSVFLTSPDGVTWTLQPVLLNNISIVDVAYGNGLFVAVGREKEAAGAVLISSDGVHWSQSSLDIQLNNIIYGNGKFVLMGYDNNYTSTDGVNWTLAPNRPPLTFADNHLIFSNGIFVDISDSTQFATSQDGIHWQTRDMGVIDYSNPISQAISVEGAVYGHGRYVVSGMYHSGDPMGGNSPVVIISSDAASWTMKALHYPYLLGHIAFGNGVFVAAGQDGEIFTSPDGIAWTVRDTGAKGCYTVEGSADGTTCTNWDPDGRTAYDTVTFCGNRFVALGAQGAGGTVSTSPDGVHWTNRQAIPVVFPAQTPVKFVVGRSFYYLGAAGAPIFTDATPYLDESSGRALVPVRCLASTLGAETGWDADTRTITITRGSTTISMAIGSTTLTVNGQKQMMDIAPQIRDGRTYLSAKYVAEALGFTVSWVANTQTVIVTQGG